MRGISNFVNKISACRRCGAAYTKTSKCNFLCPECKKEGARLGRLKRIETKKLRGL